MNVFQIKLTAVVTMLVDHVGLFLFPEQIWMRLVGRVSFPLFAWLIVNGMEHTKDSYGYISRLVIFALISQVPYWLLFSAAGYEFVGLNVLFTLGLGALGIMLVRSSTADIWKVIGSCFFAAVAQGVQSDFGFFGVFLILVYWMYHASAIRMVIAHTLLVLVSFVIPGLFRLEQTGVWDYEVMMQVGQLWGLFSLLLVWRYNGSLGIKTQRWFYWVYPGHLLLLYLLVKVV